MRRFSEATITWIGERKRAMLVEGRQIARDAQKMMRAKAPWKDHSRTARKSLRARIKTKTFGRARFQITLILSHGIWYGPILERGAKPHDIRLRGTAKPGTLSWKTGWRKRDKVHHPGIQPRAIVKPTAERLRPYFLQRMESIWRNP